ncbi:FAD-dependent monooxygenase [Peristeroidobacter soli]|uniref:FAD-dependent monooxygenase n=1 Tax=Peristeroidobacter soli TaxID=2497877 RepID=UPI00101B9F6E|nr:FAD-dependent monooxygenase [Peristeroidobacter soli]
MGVKKRVLIAGAGIGGLTAALACLDKGLDVEVFEQTAQLGEVGAGVQISPTGLRVLFALGLKEQIESVWVLPQGREMLVWNTGYRASTPTLTSYLVERYGFANIYIHRADLHDILVKAVRSKKPDAIHLNARVRGFEQSERSATVILEDGRTFSGDALIGADGLHSRVRRQMFGETPAKFTGCISWRGIVPMDCLPEKDRLRGTQNWMAPNGHFVCYPIRRGQLINIVGHIERNDWQVESWIEKGSLAEISADFAGWHEQIQTLIRNIDTPYKWALFLRPPMKEWSVGRVTLLGDACHPTLPYLGFGANMAIEDGYVLARCLQQHGDQVQAALKRYAELRIPRTTEIVEASGANQHRLHHPDLADPEKASKYIDTESARQLDLRDWLYSYDATSVAV